MGRDGSVELFRTIHGSHLYGLATEQSDNDVFIVTLEDRGRARHRQNVDLPYKDRYDITTMGWRTFVRLAQSGSHQSVEALFSPHKIWTPAGEAYRPMFEGMRITGQHVFEKYERTIKKFAYGDFKRRRHAVRLSLNLRALRRDGRFNPVLTPFEVDYVNDAALLEGDELKRWLIDWELP